MDMGFVSCSAMPTIMRHVTRRAYINVHVDDELLAANKEDGEWVIAILSQKLTLKINGPYPEIEDKENALPEEDFQVCRGRCFGFCQMENTSKPWRSSQD